MRGGHEGGGAAMREAVRAAGRPRFVSAGLRLSGRGAFMRRGWERAERLAGSSEGRGGCRGPGQRHVRAGAAVAACRFTVTSSRA